MDSWQQESMSRRQARPARPPPKVTASLSQSTGTGAADGGEMMAYHHSEKMAVLCQKRLERILVFAGTRFFFLFSLNLSMSFFFFWRGVFLKSECEDELLVSQCLRLQRVDLRPSSERLKTQR